MLRARLIRASNASEPHSWREVLGVHESFADAIDVTQEVFCRRVLLVAALRARS